MGNTNNSTAEDSILGKKQLDIIDLPKSSNGRTTPNGGVVRTNIFSSDEKIDGNSLMLLFGNQ